MSEQTISSLSIKRIIISLLIFIAIPLTAHILNIWVKQYAISLMFCMNVGGSALLIYDWNLFGIHYNRAKANAMDTIVFTIIGFIVIILWVYVGAKFLNANIVVPGETDLTAYGYARPGMFIAFSFMEAAVVSICFKCLTDRFDVRGKELQTILLSALIFGFLFTILYLPYFDISYLFRTYLYNIGLTAFLAYVYNQCHTFIPGMLAMAIVYFILMYQTIAL